MGLVLGVVNASEDDLSVVNASEDDLSVVNASEDETGTVGKLRSSAFQRCRSRLRRRSPR